MARGRIDDPEAICRRWCGDETVRAAPLATSGLSGAATWAVDRAAGSYVLKSFVGGATPERAGWVHALMAHVRAAGVDQVPSPQRAIDGCTVQADATGTLWELVERMRGAATMRPTDAQAAAAGRTLARIHRAAAALPGHAPRENHSPGVLRRIAHARALAERPWIGLDPTAAPTPLRRHLLRAIDIAADHGLDRALAAVASLVSRPCLTQPVLRDIWCDHVLFEGESVSGIIDWHAAGIDTPATDIARLVGSWPDGAESAVLEAYGSVRPLGEQEAAMVPFLRSTGVVFGLDNWFRWTVEENRHFADRELVARRVASLVEALPAAVEHLAGRGAVDAMPWS